MDKEDLDQEAKLQYLEAAAQWDAETDVEWHRFRWVATWSRLADHVRRELKQEELVVLSGTGWWWIANDRAEEIDRLAVQDIRDLLNVLPERQRVILTEVLIDGHTQRDVGRKYDIWQTTVSKIITRGLDTLRTAVNSQIVSDYSIQAKQHKDRRVNHTELGNC